MRKEGKERKKWNEGKTEKRNEGKETREKTRI